MAETITPALSVENVSFAYGERRALADVSLNVAPGQFHALLGVNGAGKSTLFALVTRLLAPDTGRILVAGHDMAAGAATLGRIGVVFQSRALDPDLTVMDNLRYHASLHALPRAKAQTRIAEVLGAVDLTERARSKVTTLSGGQLRRAEIARAMIHKPSLMLLDEPTVGLDVKARAEVLAQTRRVVAESGAAALWATHLLDEILPDDALTVLHQGRVLWQGRAGDLAAPAEMNRAFLDLTGVTT
ncbi:ATP-binding cassette domain-containing protein [Paracoccus sp. S1E-3]|uniref:ATP-binding cassette domain-containing protein n=1 Tax=Paracoccus sp. S1E-3 TaxID=2756130 RepID=UPI001C689B3D|nr:ATP-binding cassette domain-containing protein [Paracoccus sp. S1E-3]